MKLYFFPNADIQISWRPVPTILISSLAHHGIFLRKTQAIRLDKAISLSIKWIKAYFQFIISFFQKIFHLFFIADEHIVGMQNLLAIKPYVGVGV